MFFEVTVSSNELLSLVERKKYVSSMYTTYADGLFLRKNKMGKVKKFNNSIGFKPVESSVNEDRVCSPAIKSPEDYKTPEDLIFDGMETPVSGFEILRFYIPKMVVNHPDSKFSYQTAVIAGKWKKFLEKIFPNLNTSIKTIKEKPEKRLFDFAFEYFYRCLEKEVNCTIEFSSSEQLTKEEIEYMIPKLSCLSNDKLGVAQFKCDTCSEYSNGEKPYHIEIVYMTWYGKENPEYLSDYNHEHINLVSV